jgi:hypothetical protein
MKKSGFVAALVLIGVCVSGCPVYDGNDVECFDDLDCPNGYWCDARGECVNEPGNGSSSCNAPADCGTNETCSHSGSCLAGDCHFASVGCVSGYECSPASGRWECVPEGAGNNGGAPSSSAGAPTSNDGGGEPMTNGGAEPTSSAGAAG